MAFIPENEVEWPESYEVSAQEQFSTETAAEAQAVAWEADIDTNEAPEGFKDKVVRYAKLVGEVIVYVVTWIRYQLLAPRAATA